MATTRAIIPRFLLPLQGPLWRGIYIPPTQANIFIRFLSSRASGSSTSSGGSGSPAAGEAAVDSSKPIVLEKPAKFNPPSHGSRAKKQYTMPKHYGPPLTKEEKVAQGQRHYPGLMAPDGSWSHWFWHSRLLHTVITKGTLLTLAISTFFLNYAYNSPFRDLVPPISDLWRDPVYFFVAWKGVIVMHERDKSARAAEHRTAHLDDVAKRRYYMKTHGIEAKDPVTMVFGKDKAQGRSLEDIEAEAMGTVTQSGSAAAVAAEAAPTTATQTSEDKPKKRFGIF